MALAAQGFADPRPSGRIDRRHTRRLLDRIGLIQIDSVNVLVRSQELPVLARLGPHRRDLLPRLAAGGDLFEYWGHMASLIPTAHHHLYRWRMRAAADGAVWSGLARLQRERPELVAEVLELVKQHGPVSAGAIRSPRDRPKGSWWDWDATKQALELLFWTGQVTAGRTSTFERWYDLPERVLPASVLATPTPPEPDARKELLVLAARSLGVGTVADLADYHRQNTVTARPLVAELVEDARLVPVRVEGWKDVAYRHPDARAPRSIQASALLSPFDSLVWDRGRTERIFGFRYRIEIYVPQPQRVHGYYVLPFLSGDRLVARIDLKADRAAQALRVQAAHAEPTLRSDDLEPLAHELRTMAHWLGLERVAVADRGDLAAPLLGILGSYPAGSATDHSDRAAPPTATFSPRRAGSAADP